MKIRFSAALLLLLATTAAFAQSSADYAPGGAEQCLDCHDFGPESPVHNVMSGSHGTSGDAADMIGRRGCEDCHGPSADHARAPTKTSPAVSFGPRWSATTAAQDSQCLACHEADTASHWQDALHMVNNLTCVTCHDIHTEQDKVLSEGQQAEVCTVCHKTQKKGIHGMQRRAARNPPCTECHNPHDHESAEAKMLSDQSSGCSHCHDLVRMADSKRVSAKAKSYHKVMARPGRTCTQCHEGIAHAAPDAVTGMQTSPAQKRKVTLFYPGIADSDWLLQAHPGSQPLRQGASCQQCHRGDEAAMGESRGGTFQPTSRDVEVAFSREGDELLINLQWQGPKDEKVISLMWSDDSSEAFSRGGCFAACHSDLPGMSRDRGQRTSKYLGVSREQRQSIGKPSIVKGEAALQQLMVQGQFAEIWRIDLTSTTLEKAIILSGVKQQEDNLTSINKSYSNGRWSVALRHKINNTGQGVSFLTEGKYTFGIALNGANNPASKHWVSLPMTLSLGRDDTDFKAE